MDTALPAPTTLTVRGAMTTSSPISITVKKRSTDVRDGRWPLATLHSPLNCDFRPVWMTSAGGEPALGRCPAVVYASGSCDPMIGE